MRYRALPPLARVSRTLPGFAVPRESAPAQSRAVLTFISWRGIKVLCRCEGCGRVLLLRPAVFCRWYVRGCPPCAVWLGLGLGDASRVRPVLFAGGSGCGVPVRGG